MSVLLDPAAIVEANTVPQSPPLCPEIWLRLLRDDAPMRRAAGERLFVDDGPKPYWAFCWASGQALARYLLDHPDLVRGRRVLDFGSGSGVAGIAAAMAGAAEVIATDLAPLARAAIAINARLNRVVVRPSAENLVETGNNDWDVLLACDICYLANNRQWLWDLDAEEKTVLVADPGRPGLAMERLELLARFRARTVPDLEDPELTEAAVFRLRL
jgi:predicted nicotinamide N-methyase